jgi:hypothetical protein
MNFHICFCNAIDCPMRFTCARNLINYPKTEEMKYITVTKFRHTDTNCEYYMKKGNK